MEANHKAHEAAIAKKNASFMVQQKLMRESHEAGLVAQKKREIAAIALHKNEMAKKRKEFEKRFKHVWSTGPAGISKFFVTAPTQH